jgi:FMN-dependent NADH-azoreductase
VTRILVINSSVSGDASASRTLVAEAVQRLVEAHPGAVVTERDLDAAPVPHLTSATVSGVRAVAASEAERAAQALSDELIAELFAADVVVIGAPMYNFSIPTTLRAWFDHVLRPRVTFAYSEAGPEGLVKGKKVIVIESRGGLYSEGPAQVMDFQEPYLRTLLGFIGLTDVEFVHAEKIGFGPKARDAALAGAKARIAKIAAAGDLARAA